MAASTAWFRVAAFCCSLNVAAQQVSPVEDRPFTAIRNTNGGTWWLEWPTFGSPSARIVVTDQDLQPVSAFALSSDAELLESNVHGFPLPDGRVMLVMSEMSTSGFDNIFTVALAMVDASGTVLWQTAYSTNEGSSLPASTCGHCTTVRVDEHGRIFVMIPRYMSIEDLLCIDQGIGDLLWWKHTTNGTPGTNNMLAADGAGGCYWLLGNMQVLHIDANGGTDWSERLDWSTFAMGTAVELRSNGHVYVYGALSMTNALGVVELSPNGDLLNAWRYSPISSSNYVQPLELNNGHTLIATYDGALFSADANGEVVGAYRTQLPVNMTDMAPDDERILVSGSMLTPSPLHFVMGLQEDLPGHCAFEPFSLTMELLPPGEPSVAADPQPLSDVQSAPVVVGISTAPTDLPEVSPFCDLVGLSELSAQGPAIHPTCVHAGDAIVVEHAAPITLSVFAAQGSLVMPPRPLPPGRNPIGTDHLAAGMYLFRMCDAAGHAWRGVPVMIE